MRAWLTEASDHLVLVLRVQPGAKRTEVVGTHGEALRIRLAAPPVDGKANEALIVFLAGAFGVPVRNVSLLTGQTNRNKRIRVDAPRLRPDAQWG